MATLSMHTYYDTVAALKAASGTTNQMAYCTATDTWYRYEASGAAYTADDLSVTITGAGGNTRWLAVFGRYYYGAIFATVAAMEAYTVGFQNQVVYCTETESYYRYETAGSAYTDDNLFVCSTGAAGDTRWLAVLGQYQPQVRRRELTKAATGNLSIADCSGTIIDNYGQGAESTLTLPAAGVGLNVVFTCSTIGTAWHVKPYSGGIVCLNGTLLDADDKVSLATPALLDCIRFWCVKNAAAAYIWFAQTINGTWTDGGA